MAVFSSARINEKQLLGMPQIYPYPPPPIDYSGHTLAFFGSICSITFKMTAKKTRVLWKYKQLVHSFVTGSACSPNEIGEWKHEAAIRDLGKLNVELAWMICNFFCFNTTMQISWKICYGQVSLPCFAYFCSRILSQWAFMHKYSVSHLISWPSVFKCSRWWKEIDVLLFICWLRSYSIHANTFLLI